MIVMQVNCKAEIGDVSHRRKDMIVLNSRLVRSNYSMASGCKRSIRYRYSQAPQRKDRPMISIFGFSGLLHVFWGILKEFEALPSNEILLEPCSISFDSFEFPSSRLFCIQSPGNTA